MIPRTHYFLRSGPSFTKKCCGTIPRAPGAEWLRQARSLQGLLYTCALADGLFTRLAKEHTALRRGSVALLAGDAYPATLP